MVGYPALSTAVNMTGSFGSGRDNDDWRYAPYDRPRPARQNTAAWVLGGVVIILIIVLAAGFGYLLAMRNAQSVDTPASGAQSQPTSPAAAPITTLVSSPPAGPIPEPGPPAAPGPVVPPGDLGLVTPVSRPQCDGRGVVILYSAVTPGAYAEEISTALARFPGASYLRTDLACPSLRPRAENGNVIYAVYQPSGYTREELCADVRAAGPPAYGRWLDTTSDPSVLVTC